MPSIDPPLNTANDRMVRYNYELDQIPRYTLWRCSLPMYWYIVCYRICRNFHKSEEDPDPDTMPISQTYLVPRSNPISLCGEQRRSKTCPLSSAMVYFGYCSEHVFFLFSKGAKTLPRWYVLSDASRVRWSSQELTGNTQGSLLQILQSFNLH